MYLQLPGGAFAKKVRQEGKKLCRDIFPEHVSYDTFPSYILSIYHNCRVSAHDALQNTPHRII